jgi:hypothetical protein
MLCVRHTAGSDQAKGMPILKALKHAVEARERVSTLELPHCLSA